MKKPSWPLAVLILAACSWAGVSFGARPGRVSPQQPAKRSSKTGQNESDGQKVQIKVLQVRLPVVVKKKNEFVAGLTENNFRVLEDNKPQQIEQFQAPSQLPLDVAILMDTSESVKLKLPFEKDAATDFVSSITTYRHRDQVLLATFDTNVELQQDFTTLEEPLAHAIDKVRAGGYTKLYDAVCRVIEEKMANIQGTDARRVIVVLSDGKDTASEHDVKDAIALAERYDVTIFGISTKNFSGILSGMVANEDDKEMRELCDDTGGQLFLPSQEAELFKAFTQVANDLRQEYVIFYTPDNQEHSGKRRLIKVKLVAADGHVYHKQGYVY